MSEYLKKTMEKARLYDNLMEDVNAFQKRSKGYLYDSLCLRYQIARMNCVDKEAVELMDRLGLPSGQEAHAKALKAAHRDCLRFYELLDEAIGEHD